VKDRELQKSEVYQIEPKNKDRKYNFRDHPPLSPWEDFILP
jgi:hypothetical protein